MKAYLALLEDILDNGSDREDRTGVGTRSVFFRSIRHNLNEGFPLLTTKRVHFKSVKAELLWFLSGSSNVQGLRDQGVTIWDEWANKDGDVGPMYGFQWVRWGVDGINQIDRVIKSIQERPYSRRHLVSAWNVEDLPNERVSPDDNVFWGRMALAPCHFAFQFYVQDDKLSCVFHMRSADVFLGVPFNLASYALLTHMVAAQCGLRVGELVGTFNDCHLYLNHLTEDIVHRQLSREVRGLPTLVLSEGVGSVFDYTMEDIQVIGYDPHPAIKAPIAV